MNKTPYRRLLSIQAACGDSCPAASSRTRALRESRVFLCVRRARVRVASSRASCKIMLSETLSSLCNHDNRGSAHPKFLYRNSYTTWGFPPTARKGLLLRLKIHNCGTWFYYGNTEAPERLHNFLFSLRSWQYLTYSLQCG